MPLTNRDAQDAALAGTLEFQEWAREWMKEWLMPDLQTMQARNDERMVQLWDQMPADQKEQISLSDPETFAKAEKNIGVVRERLKRVQQTASVTTTAGA